MRWLNRDPIEEDGGVNLYAFCGNNSLTTIDYLGNNIYLLQGNNSGRWLNDISHQSIAVDLWSRGGKKIGKTSFSFGFTGNWIWNIPSCTWLGFKSFTLPGYLMEGGIYEITKPIGIVIKEKETTCKEDRVWLKRMRNRKSMTDVYSVLRHNCRMFSQLEFESAPRKEIR